MSFKGISAKFGIDSNDFEREVVNVVNGVMLGKTNNVGTVTLTANQDTTTVTVPPGLIGESTVIIFSPNTLNAAKALTHNGTGSMYVSSRDVLNNQFTINHQNNGETDRSFSYVFIG